MSVESLGFFSGFVLTISILLRHKSSIIQSRLHLLHNSADNSQNMHSIGASFGAYGGRSTDAKNLFIRTEMFRNIDQFHDHFLSK